MQRLKDEAEKAKIELSGVTSSPDQPAVHHDADAARPLHLEMTLTRAKFNELTADLVEKTIGPVNQALSDAGLTASEIDKVILVGGSTRIPAVQEAVQQHHRQGTLQAASTRMSALRLARPYRAAYSAATLRTLFCMDVTPLSLGIETMGGVFTQSDRPQHHHPDRRRSQIFSTAADGQTSVEVHVLQGEREMAAYNKTLGRFQLTGIAPAPRGVPQIEVTFDIDAQRHSPCIR